MTLRVLMATSDEDVVDMKEKDEAESS